MTAPALPAHISSDGREIWDWAAKLGQAAALSHKARELKEQIRREQTTCGACALWMTRQCPEESHTQGGRKRGPSMDTFKCGRFELKSSSAELIAKWEAELGEVRRKQEATSG